MEISPTEIRYKRFNHLDGPTIVIPAVEVLSIRYEDGSSEIINAAPVPSTEQTNTQVVNSKNTAMDQDRFIFGINANAGGALSNIRGGPSGFGINFELGKGKFNSEINLMIPNGGFGFLVTFNGFWPSKIGGFYLGGGLGFSRYARYTRTYQLPMGFSLPVGLNIGYKFVTKSGLYFRIGTFAAYDIFWIDTPIYLKPDLAIGWTMR